MTPYTELEEGQFKDAEVKTYNKTDKGLPLCGCCVLSVPSQVLLGDGA